MGSPCVDTGALNEESGELMGERLSKKHFWSTPFFIEKINNSLVLYYLVWCSKSVSRLFEHPLLSSNLANECIVFAHTQTMCFHLHCEWFEFEDWSFWGQCLGVEGRSVAPFLTMCLVKKNAFLQQHSISNLQHHCSYHWLRCKLFLDCTPRAIIFENVVPFPIALLKDVTGVGYV